MSEIELQYEIVQIGNMVVRRTVILDADGVLVRVLTSHELVSIEEYNQRIAEWNAEYKEAFPHLALDYFVPDSSLAA